MVRKTLRRKTYRRKTNRRKTIRYRKGGRVPILNTTSVNVGNRYIMNNGNGNGNMGNGNGNGNGNMGNGNENMGNNGNSEEDIGELINKLQEIMDEVKEKDIFIRRILELLPKARDIDNNMPGAGMEQQITQKITDILIKYDPHSKKIIIIMPYLAMSIVIMYKTINNDTITLC